MNRSEKTLKNIALSGTGYMMSLSEAIVALGKHGYTENISAKKDHLSCRSGEIEMYPKDFAIDGVIRFENTSDPDDQAILYAVSSLNEPVKGVFVDSYGLYHEPMSSAMLEKFKEGCRRGACDWI